MYREGIEGAFCGSNKLLLSKMCTLFFERSI